MKTAIAILILALVGGAALVVAGGAAMAQSLVPDTASTNGRYQMQPVEGGVARLDTATGEMSFCRIEQGRMACQPSEEDRVRLEARIRELSSPVPVVPEGRAEALTPQPLSPTGEDAEIDRAIGRMKQVFRAFRDIAREFEDVPGENRTMPNRT